LLLRLGALAGERQNEAQRSRGNETVSTNFHLLLPMTGQEADPAVSSIAHIGTRLRLSQRQASEQLPDVAILHCAHDHNLHEFYANPAGAGGTAGVSPGSEGVFPHRLRVAPVPHRTPGGGIMAAGRPSGGGSAKLTGAAPP